MKQKIDLSRNGLSMFFKDWQLMIAQILWENHNTMTCGDILKVLGTNIISKSSIVHFLEDLHEDGLILKDFKTGRGGTRSAYQMKYNRKDSIKYFKETIKERLNQI